MSRLLKARHKALNTDLDAHSNMGVFPKKFKSFFRHDSGAIAIEFAILAPLFIAGILFLGIFGILTQQYINIDQILRAGAAVAINDPGNDAVTQRLIEVSSNKGYSNINIQPGTVPGVLYLVTDRSCFCPDNPSLAISCANICFPQRPASVRYTIRGAYRHPLLVSIQQALAQMPPGFGSGVVDVSLQTRVMAR